MTASLTGHHLRRFVVWNTAYLQLTNLVLLISTVHALGPPRVNSKAADLQPQLISVVQGESRARLLCPIVSDPPAVITLWEKDGQMIHAGWQRFRIRDSGRDSGTLIISNVEPDDSGVYLCRATNGFGSAEYKIVFYVKDKEDSTIPPSFLVASKNSGATPQEKKIDEKEVIWVGGKEAEVGVLVSPIDRGGPSPPIFLPPGLRNSTVPIGHQVVFKCHIFSEMEPVIRWLKRVADEADHRISNMTLYVDNVLYAVLQQDRVTPYGNGSYLSKLTLTSVTERETGMYFCTAANLHGLSHISAYLTVVNPQSIATKESPSNPMVMTSSTHLLPVVIAIIVMAAVTVVASLILYYSVRCRQSQKRDVGVVSSVNQTQIKPPIGRHCVGAFCSTNQSEMGAWSPAESDDRSQCDHEHCHMLRPAALERTEPHMQIHSGVGSQTECGLDSSQGLFTQLDKTGRNRHTPLGAVSNTESGLESSPGIFTQLDCLGHVPQGVYDALDPSSDLTSVDEFSAPYNMWQLQSQQQKIPLPMQPNYMQLYKQQQQSFPYRSPYTQSYNHTNS